MYLIVGLGNPEEEYAKTRHNMGFNTINEISRKYQLELNRKKFDGLYCKCNIENCEVILLKPQTYMNLSGKSIKQYVDFYKIPKENIIVVYDDIDITPGKIKIKKKGSSGSHNGMKSVIQELGTNELIRIRIGIGKPEYEDDLINYVIGKNISKEECQILNEGVEKSANAIIEILLNGIDKAMNKFN